MIFVKLISFAQSIHLEERIKSVIISWGDVPSQDGATSDHHHSCCTNFLTHPMADKRLHNNNKILRTPKTKITLRRNDDVESGKQAVRRAGGIDDRMLVRCASIAFEVRWMLSFM